MTRTYYDRMPARDTLGVELYPENMEPDGLGDLYLAFEQLKQKLDREGLFSP